MHTHCSNEFSSGNRVYISFGLESEQGGSGGTDHEKVGSQGGSHQRNCSPVSLGLQAPSAHSCKPNCFACLYSSVNFFCYSPRAYVCLPACLHSAGTLYVN